VQLSPEWQVVLACARTHLQSEECQPLDRTLLETIDWDHLTALACRHGIAPLVYHHLHEMTGADVQPQGALDGLRRSYYGNVARNALLYKELNRVLDALQGIGTQVIVLKGAALAETVYPNRALRAMSDIDLLVRPEELSRVEDRLLALGYALHPHPLGIAWVKAHHYHLVFVQPKAPASAILLEIHWHLDRPSRPFTIDIEGLWARAVPARIAGVAAWVLSPEDLLLYLCLHTCKHSLTSSLRPLCDIAAIIRQYGPTIAWGQLQTRAAHWRIAPYVYLPLHLARDVVGAAVPEACLRALQPEGFEVRLLSWATADLLAEQDAPPLLPELFRLWKGPRLRDRLALVRQSLSPAAVAHAYGIAPASKRLYGYYPVRLKDLLRRYGPTLWRLLRQDPQLTALAEGKAQLAHWLQPFAASSNHEGPQLTPTKASLSPLPPSRSGDEQAKDRKPQERFGPTTSRAERR